MFGAIEIAVREHMARMYFSQPYRAPVEYPRMSFVERAKGIANRLGRTASSFFEQHIPAFHRTARGRTSPLVQ